MTIRKHLITDEQVNEIRKLYYLESETYNAIAKRYNVSSKTIQNVVNALGIYANIPDTLSPFQKANRKHPNTKEGAYTGISKHRRKQKQHDHAIHEYEKRQAEEEEERRKYDTKQ